jgi:hypothetical protein
MGSAHAQTFVQADGGQFRYCNQPVRFVGFNVRGICHFGGGDVLPYSHTGDISTNLAYCESTGAKVIRVFCAANTISAVQTGNRLQTILDAAWARRIWVIVALTDMYSTTLMHPQGDDDYYTYNGWLLNRTFFAGGYTNNYLPQALYLADRFKDHPAVFAWQLGNEIRDLSSGSTFVTFCQNVAALIRTADPNHMISAGLIGWRESNISYSQALQLYASMDFVGTHNYNGSDYDNDGDVAAALNMPYIIDEAGFHSDTYGPDRTPETNGDITKWINRGADGYLQWGLMATQYDNGDGDRYHGVDLVFHASDFWAYRDLFAGWAASFEVPGGLEVYPTAFEHTIEFGRPLADDVFTVGASGGAVFPFAVTENVDWLWVTPTSGQAECAGVPVTIHYSTTGLVPGDHAGQITITADGQTGSPQVVQVTIRVTGAPGDFDGDGDVDLDDFGKFQTCLTAAGATQNDPFCQPAKLDGDPDVDADDFAIFQGCITGANIPADPDCAN